MKLKYKNREPRPEDLEQIRQWKNIASEQEARLKEIMVSHQLYLSKTSFTLNLCVHTGRKAILSVRVGEPRTELQQDFQCKPHNRSFRSTAS